MKQSFSIDCVFCHNPTNLKCALYIGHNCILIILILASIIENHFLLKMSRQIE